MRHKKKREPRGEDVRFVSIVASVMVDENGVHVHCSARRLAPLAPLAHVAMLGLSCGGLLFVMSDEVGAMKGDGLGVCDGVEKLCASSS